MDTERQATAEGPIGLGVVGLPRAWSSRYRPALERRRDLFRVVAVYDPVGQRAAAEAPRWRVAPVDGIRSLIARPNVAALLLFGDAWYGTSALRFAIESGKPCLAAFNRAERAAIATDPTCRGDRVFFDLESGEDIESILSSFAESIRTGSERPSNWEALLQSI